MRSKALVQATIGALFATMLAMAGITFVSNAQAQAVRSLTAPTGVTITLDGQMGDWSGIAGIEVPLTKIPDALNEDGSSGDDVTATLKVATDASNIYVLVAVPDGYDYDPANHHLSPALGVEWLVDAGAGAGMGAVGPDYDTSGGMVDIWHWELDCAPGAISGGSFATGNDPDCNLDDEYATATDEREDDAADNSMTGSWDHTARASGIGADGTFVFEIKRPLQTGDPQDAQFAIGGSAKIALAYWDGNEGRAKDGGWSDAGHVQSALDGWIDVTFATAAPAASALTGASGISITLDGQMGDWSGVPGVQVPLKAIPAELNEEGSSAQSVTATLKVATDGSNIYVLVAVPDGYDYDPANHHLSPALGVQWLIDAGAGAGMGAAGPDYDTSGGMVDIWHWELDCAPGAISGGSFATGNDPDCNLDDEYATATDEREDDAADNSLTGSWDHTGRAGGVGSPGTFVFEMKRPLRTGDPQDAQFSVGSTASVALAYWDGNEGRAKDGGWSDAGHVVSALDGWITVSLASGAAPSAPSTGNAGLATETGSGTWLALGLGLLALAVVGGRAVVTRRNRS